MEIYSRSLFELLERESNKCQSTLLNTEKNCTEDLVIEIMISTKIVIQVPQIDLRSLRTTRMFMLIIFIIPVNLS